MLGGDGDAVADRQMLASRLYGLTYAHILRLGDALAQDAPHHGFRHHSATNKGEFHAGFQ